MFLSSQWNPHLFRAKVYHMVPAEVTHLPSQTNSLFVTVALKLEDEKWTNIEVNKLLLAYIYKILKTYSSWMFGEVGAYTQTCSACQGQTWLAHCQGTGLKFAGIVFQNHWLHLLVFNCILYSKQTFLFAI